MLKRKEYNKTLPGNPRYQPKQLRSIFGYDYLYRGVILVEIAVLRVLIQIGVIPTAEAKLLTPKTRKRMLAITTTQVDGVESRETKHDIGAVVRIIQRRILRNNRLARWAHAFLTSYDVLDTGRILHYIWAYDKALKPAIKKVVASLVEMIERTAEQIQVGRTHGQHALPITVGFWLSTILYRILYNWQMMENRRNELVGKISGAVGAYNAQVGLGIAEKCGNITFEARVLKLLGLKPAPISTQILPPEPLAYFLHACAMLSAALGQFGRDGQGLMRTEIAEVAEAREKGQVGSSTMAQKRNPINFENLEGMWIRTKNEFGKVLDTLISDHQRNLVGSSVMRDFPIIIVNLMQQLNTLNRANKQGVSFLSRITINADRCQQNFASSSHLILAEPIYIALQMAGYRGDAHKLVNEKLVPRATKEGVPLIIVLEVLAEEDGDIKEALGSIPSEVIELMYRPENYTGWATKKSLEIVAIAKEKLAEAA
ncbi:MAG: lyase family protein [Patescibacteria group bacterium]|nr:lyase family protein [Patescibacteria group bacterium]